MLARMTLWRVGLDYQHGTGHGVGHFLNVHEGTLLPNLLFIFEIFVIYFIFSKKKEKKTKDKFKREKK